MFKQAMNSVESKLDKAFVIQGNDNGNNYQDVYIDPITGFTFTTTTSSTTTDFTGSILKSKIDRRSISLQSSESDQINLDLKNDINGNSENILERDIEENVNDLQHLVEQRERQLMINDLQHLVEQRERQLMSAIEQNAMLNDSLEQLKLQLKDLEELKAAESKISQERIDRLENQLQKSNLELNTVRQKISNSEDSSSTQDLLEYQRNLLSEKEDQITGLLAEGEKLSRNELMHRNSLKKHHKKEAEQEQHYNDLFRKYEKSNQEISKLNSKLQLYNKANLELNELNENLSSPLQTSTVLEKEVLIREKLNKELEKLRNESVITESNLRMEINELRSTLSKVEEQSGLREDNLRQEILGLQKKLQITEISLEDSTAEEWNIEKIQVLRQIENLHTQHTRSLKNWEIIESNLTSRLNEIEASRRQYKEKYDELNSELKEMSTKFQQQELALILERSQNSKLLTELDYLKSKQVPKLELQIQELTAKIGSIQVEKDNLFKETKEKYDEAMKKLSEEFEKRLKYEQDLRLFKEQQQDGNKKRIKFDTIRRNNISQTSFKSIESQVNTLQSQLNIATRNRDELANELVKLTVQLEEMTIKKMLGEKTEKVEELQDIIDDMRDVYKNQITELASEVEKYTNKSNEQINN
ncbi:8974_t:CDS:10 [Entrophospora sp. SA101]|nr:8974_t:CDS:10 [Entrophospora sp. SA101]